MASAKRAIKIEGLSDLENALHELPRATGGNVLKRSIVKSAQVFADRAKELAPVSAVPTHKFHLKDQIVVGKPKIITAGKAAYADAMKSGSSRSQAAEAAHVANSVAGGAGRRAVVQVGPTHRAFYGLFQEFGTAHNPPHPFMRPAWDEVGPQIPGMIRDDLTQEIEKARKRLAKKAERLAAKIRAGA
jgi:HK97 gp10 family phage protein